MVKITLVEPDGKQIIVDGEEGSSLMQAAVAAGVTGIVAECGGSMMCATCHVYVNEADLEKLPEKSEGEEEMLDSTASERKENSRLSCQIKIGPELEGFKVYLPESQY